MHCDLDLWLFDLKIYRAHPWLMGSLHVKFHVDRCKGKAVMRQKPKCGRQTDGRTDGHGDSSIPPNFFEGGITTDKGQKKGSLFIFYSRTRLWRFVPDDNYQCSYWWTWPSNHPCLFLLLCTSVLHSVLQNRRLAEIIKKKVRKDTTGRLRLVVLLHMQRYFSYNICDGK